MPTTEGSDLIAQAKAGSPDALNLLYGVALYVKRHAEGGPYLTFFGGR